MDSFSFEDFIPTYPEDSDPDIQHLITIKNEFLEVSGTVSEPTPKRGEYYRHQKALFRYMVYHDRILNIQETGTGKSCSLVAIAEYFKKFKDEPASPIKHVYVLEKGQTTVDEFRKQIACTCTPLNNEYITEKVTDITLRDRDRKSNLTRALRKWYTVQSYGVFASEIEKRKLTPKQMEDEFSGCIFFVDEAHNLSEDLTVNQRKKETNEDNKEEQEQEIQKRNNYNILWKLFHTVKRCKIILGTATPMINEVNEIAPIMNLILPMDQQMPVGKWNYENTTLEQLEPFFRGRVSYVRGLDTGAKVIYQGERMEKTYDIDIPKEGQTVNFTPMVRDITMNILSLPNQPKLEMIQKEFSSQSMIQKVVMSKFQREGYRKAAGEDSFEETKSESKENKEEIMEKKVKKEVQAFKIHERNASCFVFPDYSYGGDFTKFSLTTKAGKFIKPERTSEGKRKPNSYKLEPNFKEKVKVLKNLQEMSAKFAFIVENELNPDNIGNCFIFSELVTGSGAILLGKILEEYGFAKFKEHSSVFQSKGVKAISVCAEDSMIKSLKSTFKEGLRYGILSNDMSSDERSALLELFNSPQNRNGEYCKILIGTPVVQDGINVFNVRRGYLLTPMWHPSGMHQALSRFIRSTSHQMLIEDERQRLVKEGKDPNLATVVVKIYKMASVKSFQDKDSVDLELYQLTERKDIHIRRMMRFLKQCAFDCPIHYHRNVRKGDVEGSAICDYMECKYTCFPSRDTNQIPEKEIDFSTYDILYSQEVIDACKTEIIQLMKDRTSIAIGDLYKILDSTYKRKFINAAVDSVVADRLTLRDRFGNTCFLNSNGILLYTQGDLPSSSIGLDVSDISYYKDLTFAYTPNRFDNLINEASKEEQQDLIDRIEALEDPFEKDFNKMDNLVNKLSDKNKILLLEKYIDKIKEGNRLARTLNQKFYNYIIETLEPKNDIQNVKRYLEEIKLKPGREREETDKPIVDIKYEGPPSQNYMYPDGSKTKKVYILTYSENVASKSSYNAFSNFLNSNQDIRINVSGEGWRRPTAFEYPAYNHIVSQHIQTILKKYEDLDEYGSFLGDKKFRIQKNRTIDGKPKKQVCTSYEKIELIELLFKYNYSDPKVERIIVPKKFSKKEDFVVYFLQNKMIKKEIDVENFTLEKMRYIYQWNESQINKESMCDILGVIFYENDLMLIA